MGTRSPRTHAGGSRRPRSTRHRATSSPRDGATRSKSGSADRFERELRQTLDPEVSRTLVEEELDVEGHRAVRLEYETLADLIGEPGLHYQYVIELDRNTTLIVHTTATRGVEGVYEENRTVVDLAVDTLLWLPARV